MYDQQLADAIREIDPPPTRKAPMNHWKNIAERVKALEEKADLEAGSSPRTSDLATIVRDLAAEVALLAKLMAERQEAEEARADF